jgi:hypothetical protein
MLTVQLKLQEILQLYLLTKKSSKLLLLVDMLKQCLEYVPMKLASRSVRYTVIRLNVYCDNIYM